MAIFKKHPPQILFQAAVAIGCVALLLGAAGVVYYGKINPAPAPQLAVGEATVLIEGLPDLEGLRVEAEWVGPRGGTFTESGRSAETPGAWLFRIAPAATPLRLRVYRRTPTGLLALHDQPGVFARGAHFVIHLHPPSTPGAGVR